MSTSILATSVAQSCRATREQVGLTGDQVELIKTFLEIGNSPEFKNVKELVLERVFGRASYRYDWWNQLMIFFALRTMCPEGTKFESFGNVENVWRDFSTYTKTYGIFFKRLGVQKIHRDLLSSARNVQKPHWFTSQVVLTRFMSDTIPEYRPHFWAYLGTDF